MRNESTVVARRVLIGAYACGPVAEPEARAAWEMALAACHTADEVVVVTRPRFRLAIEAAVAASPAGTERLQVHYLDLPAAVVRLKRGPGSLYWFYLLWQRALTARARQLHRRHRFTVLHHATFANDWMPSGLAGVRGLPLVWGPVGGSSRLPVARLARWLGVRGTVTELARVLLTAGARGLWGRRIARRAALMVAQNEDVAAVYATLPRRIEVEPNAALDTLPTRDPATVAERHAVFAGRLIAWKGAALALDAIAHPHARGWTLTVYGDGYARRALERRARRRGIADRVVFAGHRPRDEVLAAMAQATAFLFPSLHDQAGWVVAEASAMGCPVVCLPLGGPPLLAKPNDYVASLESDVVMSLADRLNEAAATGGSPSDRWSRDRLPATLDGWYTEATGVVETPVARRRPLRVLEGFGEPKRTTNPYITQLHRALSRRDDLEVQTFTFRRAILGRYDVVHLHWPELMIDGHRRVSRILRRTLTVLAALRWRVASTPVVRTRHNLERPSDLHHIDRLVLDLLDGATKHDIVLNAATPVRPGVPLSVISHGHYRDWYPPGTADEAVAGRIGYVGLIRRYKGVEDLAAAFAAWPEAGVSLRVTGRASHPSLVDEVLAAVGDDPRVTVDSRYLEDEEFAAAIREAELIVLPYRHMHNSGTVIAALSLRRPVLVPDNPANRLLADEMGPGWVHVYEGQLSRDDLDRAWKASRGRSVAPDLSGREWPDAAAAHAVAFHTAARAGRRRFRGRETLAEAPPGMP